MNTMNNWQTITVWANGKISDMRGLKVLWICSKIEEREFSSVRPVVCQVLSMKWRIPRIFPPSPTTVCVVNLVHWPRFDSIEILVFSCCCFCSPRTIQEVILRNRSFYNELSPNVNESSLFLESTIPIIPDSLAGAQLRSSWKGSGQD